MVGDESNGRVRHYVNKPHSFFSADISCGIYVMDPGVFDVIREVCLKPRVATAGNATHAHLIWNSLLLLDFSREARCRTVHGGAHLSRE